MKKKTLIHYWDNYYVNSKKFQPSSFARLVLKKIKGKTKYNRKMIDIGCGNGRDSFFFSKNKFNVLGIDISKKAIETNSRFSNNTLRFLQFDIEKNTILKKFDFIYSRFFLHAINENAEDKLIKLIKRIKKKGTLIFFEFRNHKDKIFRKKIIKHNQIIEFEKGHFRRIIESKKFIFKLQKNLKCKILYNKSSKNLSIMGNDNPNLTRLIVKLL